MKKFLLTLAMTVFLGENAMANALNMEQQAIAATAANAALGNQTELKLALNNGLDSGVTVNEFKEILVQAYAYCGFPRALNALGTLMQTIEERGNKDELGKEPNVKPQGDALIYGTENQTKLVGSKVEGKLFEFAPAIDEYLKSHLFGDIFSRNNVDWKTRELEQLLCLLYAMGLKVN